MFRLGGNTDQGIMSGVAPRQGYYKGTKVSELGERTIGELEDMARQSTRGDRRADMRDFMVDWGLGMVGTPPTGNILSTAANVARAPYERFIGRKAERRGTESDMFSTLFKGAAEAQGEAKAGKGWLEQWKFQQVPVLLSTIDRIEAIPEDQRTSDQQRELDAAKINLDNIKAKDPLVDFILRDEVGGKLFKKIKTQLLEQDQQSDKPIYSGEDDPQLWKDAIKNFSKAEREQLVHKAQTDWSVSAGGGGRAAGKGGTAKGKASSGEKGKKDESLKKIIGNKLIKELNDIKKYS